LQYVEKACRGSDWLTVKGMEGTMRDVVEVYLTIISWIYLSGTEEQHEVSGLV
jgi:hypothetical protein